MIGFVFDDRACSLGEGPLWHPQRQQLFWFDINNKTMLSRDADRALEWRFDRQVSAAGWISSHELLVASESDLFVFDVETKAERSVAPLEAERRDTRSNDGRADPWGGFWIGTMGKQLQPHAGAIYRFYQGEVRKLFDGLTIPNAICFAPNQALAYFTDTPSRKIMRQGLDKEGWPQGSPEIFIDLTDDALNPDGAVVDADGCLWCAQWGASRVARYSPEGGFLSAITFPARHTSCPAFGGADLQTLFVTTAAEGMESPSRAQGRCYAADLPFKGQPEHQVIGVS